MRSICVWARVPGGGAVEIFITYRPYMDYSSYMETTIFRTASMLGFRRLQSYMLPCLYALLIAWMHSKTPPMIQIGCITGSICSTLVHYKLLIARVVAMYWIY